MRSAPQRTSRTATVGAAVIQNARRILYNVTSIRSFSEAERKKNLGGGFWIKAVTGYSLLADVFLFIFSTAVEIVLKNFKISFSVLDFGQRG